MNKEYAEIMSVTPEMATLFLTKNKVNRPPKQNVVDYYARLMKDGKWLLNGEGLSFDKNGNLINGQHRLLAVVKADVTVRFTVTHCVDDKSFSSFDSGNNRSISDVFGIAGIPNYVKVSSIMNKYLILKRLETTIMGGKSGADNKARGSQRLSKEEILECYYPNSELIQAVCCQSVAFEKNLKIISATQMGAIMLYLILDKFHDKEIVYEFFSALNSLESCQCKAIKCLQKLLIKDNRPGNKAKMTGNYKQHLLIKAWNAYISGKDLKVLTWNEGKEGKLTFI